MAYIIVAHGKPHMKPSEFAFNVKKGPGGGVDVKFWGVDNLFKRSFQIAGKSGAAGLRMRLTADRKPIRGFDGPNLAKEAETGATPAVFAVAVAEFVAEAVTKHIAKAIG
jgi:hypothetical protein